MAVVVTPRFRKAFTRVEALLDLDMPTLASPSVKMMNSRERADFMIQGHQLTALIQATTQVGAAVRFDPLQCLQHHVPMGAIAGHHQTSAVAPKVTMEAKSRSVTWESA